MKKIITAVALGLGVAMSAQAASFVNGGFENGDFSGWTQGSGYWGSGANNLPYTASPLPLNPSVFDAAGANYNAGAQASAIVGVGVDAITGQSTVRYGNFSARINNSVNNYTVNTIKQSVSNYSGTSINFSWAAVLESSHGASDSDHFALKVVDDTDGTTLYDQFYSSFSAPGIFNSTSGWYWNNWTDVTLNVTQGHNFTIYLLAADCPYGGHAGYVYLDGFGTTQGGPGDNGNSVPEPSSLALAGLGLVALVARRRKLS